MRHFGNRSDLSRLKPEYLAMLGEDRLAEFLARLQLPALINMRFDWRFWARPHQLPPTGDWNTWLLLAGRGSGKTRAGSEWVREQVMRATVQAQPIRLALVGPSLHDAREVMVQGASGLFGVFPPDEQPTYHPSRRLLVWPNGSMAQVFSAEDADGLRGPQFHAAWCDEFCAWRDPGHVLAMVRMGLRLGNPRLVVTTTPRPILALTELMAEPGTRTSRARSRDNLFLPPSYLDMLQDLYGGTWLGRQELDGEILRELPGSMWNPSLLARCVRALPPGAGFSRVVVAVDPPASSGKTADACGIVVAGLREDGDGAGHAWVLADETVQGASPTGWASRVRDAFDEHAADKVVAEANQGGELVRTVLQIHAPGLPVRLVHARRGKRVRAEPVAALYEQDRVHHIRPMPDLELQMCRFATTAQDGSPDRVDALVWAIWELLLQNHGDPRIRAL